jgi:short-subunit dehydrogenase
MKNKINSLDDLNGKLAVISGASSGIGKAIATKLAKHGCELVILDINNEAGIQTKKELSEYSKTEFLNVDVSSQEALLEIAEKIKPRKIDFLVNVAGISLFEKKR